jgi:hypothetical protein
MAGVDGRVSDGEARSTKRLAWTQSGTGQVRSEGPIIISDEEDQ